MSVRFSLEDGAIVCEPSTRSGSGKAQGRHCRLGAGPEGMMLIDVSELGSSPRVLIADISGREIFWFCLEEDEDKRLHVYIDGRENSPTRWRLFAGSRHPSRAEGVLLELGSPEEGVIVSAISRWLDSAPPGQLGLVEYGWERIRDAVLRIGSES